MFHEHSFLNVVYSKKLKLCNESSQNCNFFPYFCPFWEKPVHRPRDSQPPPSITAIQSAPHRWASAVCYCYSASTYGVALWDTGQMGLGRLSPWAGQDLRAILCTADVIASHGFEIDKAHGKVKHFSKLVMGLLIICKFIFANFISFFPTYTS